MPLMTHPAVQMPAEQTRPEPQLVPSATGVPEQVPLWQVSPVVQGLPSLQAVLSAALGFEQVPFDELQVPGMWHWSSAVQTFGEPETQVPFWQVSPMVHGSLSSQGVPFDLLV